MAPTHAPGPAGRVSPIQRAGAVIWPSFFAAGVATTVFFAIVDPLELAAITWPQWEISRPLGYTIGFFLFWSCTCSASLFTTLLLQPPARERDANPDSVP
ncbi:MAG: hypothetical protein GXC76_10805 [Rhodanobacteraceae bacterium]|nr:hypothetical protein [Rhodanobacteraceae bacterium]